MLFSEFYTYLHCRPDGTPFYVGKGTGKRSHNFNARNQHHKNIVAKHGIENIGVFVFPCESETQAHADEIQHIAQLRREGHKLCNQTDGGEGSSGYIASIETRKKISLKAIGRIVSKETGEKISRKAMGRKSSISQEARNKMSTMMTGNKFGAGHKVSEEQKQKTGERSQGNRYCVGKKHSEETRKQMSLSAMGNKNSVGRTDGRGRKASPEAIDKMKKALTGRKIPPETRARMADAAKKRWVSQKQKGLNSL